MSRPRAWLLSAYHGDSHAWWTDWLIAAIDTVDWQLFSLPGRHFRWRIRGNPLSWWDALPQDTPDLLVATSMVDLATLRGLHPRLAGVPALYYFHENQFAYPNSAEQHRSVDPQMVQLYGALASQSVLFNSAYNRASFLQGVHDLSQRLPEPLPQSLLPDLQRRSRVLPVPIHPVAHGDRLPGLILWPHRWEYDKAPQLFAEAVCRLHAEGLEFRLALLGARARKPHPALIRLREHCAARILVDGFLPREQYLAWLARASIVISSTDHEFQGLAVLEAASAGATPLVPDRLCYPEQYPTACRYPAGDIDALTRRLRQWLEQPAQRPATDVSRFTSEALRPQWRQAIHALLQSDQ